MKSESIFSAGLAHRNAQEIDAARISELRSPLPHIDDPLVRVRVLVPFVVASPGLEGRVAAVDEIVSVPTTLAQSLVALHRCEII
jgi:hypothetical protein